MSELKIALVGAPNTGKSQLAAALTHTLKTSGVSAAVVVASTPALQANLEGYDLTLLMGLETPIPGSHLLATPATCEQQREAADHSIRSALSRAAVPYRVIYGLAEERLTQAIQAVESLLPPDGKLISRQIAGPSPKTGAWVWACDKCSDPQCEHRLLSDLLASRAGTN